MPCCMHEQPKFTRAAASHASHLQPTVQRTRCSHGASPSAIEPSAIFIPWQLHSAPQHGRELHAPVSRGSQPCVSSPLSELRIAPLLPVRPTSQLCKQPGLAIHPLLLLMRPFPDACSALTRATCLVCRGSPYKPRPSQPATGSRSARGSAKTPTKSVRDWK